MAQTRSFQGKKDSSSPPKAKKLRSKQKCEAKKDEFSNPPVNTVENDNSPKKVAASEAKQKFTPLIEEEDYFTCCITRYAELKVIENIKRKLNKRQTQMFRQSCFKNFLDLENKKLIWAVQVIHHLLLRQIDQPNREELWCLVGGKKLRFSINEYSLITGLLCEGELGDENKIYEDRLRDKYFDGNESITRLMLENTSMNYEGDNNTDCVKLALAYFVENLFMAKENTKLISQFTLKVVDNLDGFNQYPWSLQSSTND